MNEFTLSNGLKVLHKEVKDNPLVTIQLFLRGGTISETEKEAGLAQFTQVLLTQGTKKRSSEQLAQEIEDIGGSISSDTEHDYCSVGISLMDAHFEKAMDILSDVLLDPSFPADEIEKERENILASLQSRKDQIFYVANDLFNQAFYGTHPYSWPDVGKAETVSKFTREDFIRWHRSQYAARNMLMVVAGNVSVDRAKALAEKYFAPLPRGEAKTSFPRAEAPQRQEIRETTKKFKQAFYLIGFPAPHLGGTDFTALKVTNALLGGRMSGRLFVELREKLSLAYEVNSFYPSRRELSRFGIYLGLERGNLGLARKRIQELLSELKEKGVDEKELSETKRYIRGVYLLDHQTIGRQAWYLGWWETMGPGYAYDDKYLDDLGKVSVADVQKAAQTYFTDRNVQVEITPEEK
ncbi:MAG: M16 family metallopeptidase [Endomicrobiales bacterium]